MWRPFISESQHSRILSVVFLRFQPHDETLRDPRKIQYLVGALRAEVEKEAPSDKLIGDIMKTTFANRRADVAAGTATTRVLEDYPCLLEAKWVSVGSFCVLLEGLRVGDNFFR